MRHFFEFARHAAQFGTRSNMGFDRIDYPEHLGNRLASRIPEAEEGTLNDR